MVDANPICGCIIDETDEFFLKDLNCKDNIETIVYSKFVDELGEEMPCHCCGSPVSKESLKKYIKSKLKHTSVYPTCNVQNCAQNKSHKWRNGRKRNIDKAFANAEKLKKKIKILLKRRRANSDEA